MATSSVPKPIHHQVITNRLIAECVGCHWHLAEVREFAKPVAIVCTNEDCNYYNKKMKYPSKLTLEVLNP